MAPRLIAAAAFGIAYRPMTDADLPFVEALFASTRAEEFALTGLAPEQLQALLVQQHKAQHHHYRLHHSAAEWLIVERADEPIGRLYLDRSGESDRVIDISLAPAARGQGIGGAILADVIADAQARERTVSIHVETRNPARRLYERLGFEIVGDAGIYLRMERRARGRVAPGA